MLSEIGDQSRVTCGVVVLADFRWEYGCLKDLIFLIFFIQLLTFLNILIFHAVRNGFFLSSTP